MALKVDKRRQGNVEESKGQIEKKRNRIDGPEEAQKVREKGKEEAAQGWVKESKKRVKVEENQPR